MAKQLMAGLKVGDRVKVCSASKGAIAIGRVVQVLKTAYYVTTRGGYGEQVGLTRFNMSTGEEWGGTRKLRIEKVTDEEIEQLKRRWEEEDAAREKEEEKRRQAEYEAIVNQRLAIYALPEEVKLASALAGFCDWYGTKELQKMPVEVLRQAVAWIRENYPDKYKTE